MPTIYEAGEFYQGLMHPGSAWICQFQHPYVFQLIDNDRVHGADTATSGSDITAGLNNVDGVTARVGTTTLITGGAYASTGLWVQTPTRWFNLGVPKAVAVRFGDEFAGTVWFLQEDGSYKQGAAGTSGYSGYSAYSGWSGSSGTSGWSAYSGASGQSGYSGISGASGSSGVSGGSGGWGYRGYSGGTGGGGTSGASGNSGASGYSGYSGYSGWSGTSGISGSASSFNIQVASLCSFSYGNQTASGSQTIDGGSTGTKYVLLVAQTTGSQNGFYLANTSGAWTKQADPDVCVVMSGTVNARVMFAKIAANTWSPIYGVLS